MKKILLVALTLLLAASTLFAQQTITVSGVVSDEIGPVIGVGVIQKGTTNGVATDMDGKYSITVPAGSTIVFSSVGYVTQEITASSNTLDVVLAQDTQMLEETVVVGYGVQRKSDVTGAISSVKADDLQNRSVTDVATSLEGKTAGVQLISTSGAPGSDASIRIRGYSSNSSSDPLYVVDGLRTKSIADLDPNDIESMEILKDAASAAIYGAQAGNGVVLITTKKASQGVRQIRYDMQLTANQMTHVPQALDAKDYITWVTEYADKGSYLVSPDRIKQFYDGKTDTDWADVAFETGSMQRHNLSFQGANNNGSLFTSLSYLDNDGPVVGNKDSYKRFTYTLNADYKIKDWLKFTTNNSFTYSKISAVRAGGMYSLPASTIQMDPLTPVTYSKDNVPAHMASLIAQGHIFITDDNGDYYSMSPFQESNNINPYILTKSIDPDNEMFNIRGTTALDFTPWKFLTITSRLGYTVNSSTGKSVTWPYVANTDTTTDYVTISGSAGTNTYYQWENFANFNKTFDKHGVSAMVGMAYAWRANYSVLGSIQGTSSSDIGITKLDPNYAYFANQTGTAVKTVSGGEKINQAELSYFGRVSYDYDNKYHIQVSLRADAADLSILPLNTRWGYFPAVSAGWTVSRENWFRNLGLNAISNFKLRGSWGQNGSIAGLGNYMYASTIASNIKLGMDKTGYATGSVPNAIGNYDLKWETSEQTDLGFDLRMFRDRLTIGYDYYVKKTKDLIMSNVTSSLAVGGTLSPLNAGNVKNSGHEIEISWRDKIGDFSYGISGNVATLDNEVTYVYETLNRVAGGAGGSGITTYFEKGYPIWYMRGYRYAGVAANDILDDTGKVAITEGSPLYYNKDGKKVGGNEVNDEDKTMIGSGIPDVNYGITLNLGWKNLSLTVFGSGAAGNEVAYAVPRSTRTQANTLQYIFDNRWTESNRNAKFPSSRLMDWGYAKFLESDAYVFDGSYFKIKQIQLGYNFPKKLIDKIHLSSLRVYVSLDDWFIFTDYPGFDPEVSMSSNALGIDYGQYPSIKKTVFGLNVAF